MAFITNFINNPDISQIRIQKIGPDSLGSEVFKSHQVRMEYQITFKKAPSSKLMQALLNFSLPKTAQNNVSKQASGFSYEDNHTFTLTVTTAGLVKSVIQAPLDEILKTLFEHGLLRNVVGDGKTRLEKDQFLAFFEEKYSLDIFSKGDFISQIAPGESKVIKDILTPKSKL